jgi:hypothetical protein
MMRDVGNMDASMMIASRLLLLLVFVTACCLMAMKAFAQTEIPIRFVGEVRALDGNTLRLNQLSVDIANAQVNLTLNTGDVVIVQGVLRPDRTITAEQISAFYDSEANLSIDLGADAEILIIGPVQAVNNDIVTVYDFDVRLEPGASLLHQLYIGDLVRIEAQRLDGSMIARTVSKLNNAESSDQALIEGNIGGGIVATVIAPQIDIQQVAGDVNVPVVESSSPSVTTAPQNRPAPATDDDDDDDNGNGRQNRDDDEDD